MIIYIEDSYQSNNKVSTEYARPQIIFHFENGYFSYYHNVQFSHIYYLNWTVDLRPTLAFEILGSLDLDVPFTPSTPNRQNRKQVCLNICAGVRRSTPSSEVV